MEVRMDKIQRLHQMLMHNKLKLGTVIYQEGGEALVVTMRGNVHCDNQAEIDEELRKIKSMENGD